MTEHTNVPYKDALTQRLADLKAAAPDASEWEASFIVSVSGKAHREGVLSLSPKQVAKVEELWDKLCS